MSRPRNAERPDPSTAPPISFELVETMETMHDSVERVLARCARVVMPYSQHKDLVADIEAVRSRWKSLRTQAAERISVH